MNWPAPGNGTAFVQPIRPRHVLLGFAVLAAAGLGVLMSQPTLVAAAGTHPPGEAVGSDFTPTPRPRINSVSPNDDTVVRPDNATGVTVNGLPTSGIGFAAPMDGPIQRCTNLAVAALALNALVPFGIAI